MRGGGRAAPAFGSARLADDRGDRAVVGHGIILGTEAPDDVVGEFRTVDRKLAFGDEAGAPPRHADATAVAIGNQVALAVGRVVAARHPGSGRQLGARRAAGERAARAVTDVAVDRAVPPVVAPLDVEVLRLRLGAR